MKEIHSCYKQFGISRGVCSRIVLQEFESLSPVRTYALPRTNAKPRARWLQARVPKTRWEAVHTFFTKKYIAITTLDILRNSLIDQIIATNNEKLLSAIDNIFEFAQVEED